MLRVTYPGHHFNFFALHTHRQTERCRCQREHTHTQREIERDSGRERETCKHELCVSSLVSIQTQSLALASSQSWLPPLRPSIPIGWRLRLLRGNFTTQCLDFHKMMAAVVSVRLSVCRVPRPNSRTERPRKSKIGRVEAHLTPNS